MGEMKCTGDSIARFQLVIASNISVSQVAAISKLCWKNSVPFIHVRSYGLIGSYRLQTNRHDIIESKPDGEFFDLRICDPFEALQELANTIDIDCEDSMLHSHIPFILILLKHISLWRVEVPCLLHIFFVRLSCFFIPISTMVSCPVHLRKRKSSKSKCGLEFGRLMVKRTTMKRFESPTAPMFKRICPVLFVTSLLRMQRNFLAAIAANLGAIMRLMSEAMLCNHLCLVFFAFIKLLGEVFSDILRI